MINLKYDHLVIGSTGLVGKRLLKLLSLQRKNVIAVSRRKIKNLPENVSELIVNFDSLDKTEFPKCDHIHNCLGTTMKAAKSKENFKKVDFDYSVIAAKKALESGATEISIVSSVGADHNSNNFYLKTKGLLINKILTMGFDKVNVYQPGLLIGKRDEKRILESIGHKIAFLIDPLLIGKMKKYRSIKVDSIVAHMIKPKLKGINYFHYEDIINEK